MIHLNVIRRIGFVAMVVGALGVAHAADDDHAGSDYRLAEIIVSLQEAGESAKIAKHASTYKGSALELGVDVIECCWRAALPQDAPRDRTLALLELVVRHTSHCSEHQAFSEMVDHWASLSDADWAHERERSFLCTRLRWLHDKRLHHTTLRVMKSQGDAIGSRARSFFAWRILRYTSFAMVETGNVHGCIEASKQAAELAVAASWIQPALRAYHVAIRACRIRKDERQAVELEDRVLELVREAESVRHQIRAVTRIGISNYNRSQYRRCIAVFEAFREGARHADVVASARYELLRLLAKSYQFRGQHREALDVIQEFASFAKTQRDDVRMQEALVLQATQNFALGKTARSLQLLESAASMRPAKGEASLRLNLLRDLASQRSYLGDPRGGIRAAKEAVGIAVANGWKTREAHVRNYIAGAHFRLGELDQAEQEALAGRKALDPAKEPARVTELEVMLGQISEKRKAWNAAAKHYDKALRVAQEQLDADAVRSVRVVRGLFELHRGNYAEALTKMQSLRDVVRDRGLVHAVIEAGIAHSAHGSNQPRVALPAAKHAIQEYLATLDGMAAGDASPRQWRMSALAEVGLVSAMTLSKHGAASSQQHAEDAFWFLELARSIQLRQAIAAMNIVHTLPDDLAKEDAQVRTRLRKARKRWQSIAANPASTEQQRAGAKSDLEAVWVERDRTTRKVQRHSRRDGLLARMTPATPQRLQQSLGKGDRYVAYACTDSKVLAWVASNDSTRVVDLGPVNDLFVRVEALRRRLSTDGVNSDELAKHLYRRLIAPVRAHLTGATRLLISPDARIAALPWAALMDASGKRLIEHHAILCVTSATAYLELRASLPSAGTGLLAVTNPDTAPTLPRLPASELEVAALTAHFKDAPQHVLTGKGATIAALQQTIGHASSTVWKVAHFACHGVMDAEHPERSGLVLTGPETWTADAVAASRIRAELVVLSACNTARGVPALGEGLLGLSRAFLWAGAKQVIASAWRVEDQATARFFKGFYEDHLKKGHDVPAALQEAMRRAIQSGISPSLWSAFVVWG